MSRSRPSYDSAIRILHQVLFDRYGFGSIFVNCEAQFRSDERTVHDDRSKGCHGVGLRMTRRSVFFIKFYLIGMDSDLSSSIAKRNSSSRCSGVKGSRVGIGGFDCKPDSVDASGAEVAADSLNGPPLSGSTNRVRVFTLWRAR